VLIQRNLDISGKVKVLDAAVPAGDTETLEARFEKVSFSELLGFNRQQIVGFEVVGESMIDDGIHSGDFLIMDEQRSPHNGDVVVANLNGEFTVKRFRKLHGTLSLVPSNQKFQVRDIFEGEDFAISGVITHVLHKFER
jgi:DNA polymerase V